MTDVEQSAAARQFITNWQGRRGEKQDTLAFWMELLRTVYDVQNPERYIKFEMPVKIILKNTTRYIDGFIISTGVLIEQKGAGKDLDKKYPQSDGTMCTPFEQAYEYKSNLPHNRAARWIITALVYTWWVTLARQTAL